MRILLYSEGGVKPLKDSEESLLSYFSRIILASTLRIDPGKQRVDASKLEGL